MNIIDSSSIDWSKAYKTTRLPYPYGNTFYDEVLETIGLFINNFNINKYQIVLNKNLISLYIHNKNLNIDKTYTFFNLINFDTSINFPEEKSNRRFVFYNTKYVIKIITRSKFI